MICKFRNPNFEIRIFGFGTACRPAGFYLSYRLTSNTHNTAINGPSIPTIIPPVRKSFCLSNPVLYTIKFGGVEMGRKTQADEDSATEMATSVL